MSSDSLLQAGLDLGTSDWVLVGADMNQVFADVTLDPILVEMDGRTFAHGMLTVSLLPHLLANAMEVGPSSYVEEGYLLNYGFNKLRLIEPLPIGSQVRGHFRTSDDGPDDRGAVVLIPIDATIEIEGTERPALSGQIVAAWQR
ncbi:MAG: dehydratase [Actinomycetota bacterium]